MYNIIIGPKRQKQASIHNFVQEVHFHIIKTVGLVGGIKRR